MPFGQNIDPDNPYELYVAIKKSKLEFPKYAQDPLFKEVVSTLLTREPSERAIKAEPEKIKRMEYF